MSVRYPDSLDKVKSYLKLLTTDEVTISPLFYRDYTCPVNCGGCCPKFSLVYLDGPRWEKFKETYPDKVKDFTERKLENGTTVYEDHQRGNENHHCKNLDMSNGRCTIHEANPFSCEFELLKITNVGGRISVINKLFGRGWQLKKIDGIRGALCEMKPFNYQKFLRDLNLLKELHVMAEQLSFNETILPEIIEHLEIKEEYLKNGMESFDKQIIRKKK